MPKKATKSGGSRTFGDCIITANYRDRKSPFKYLIREKGQAPEASVPCKKVEAVDVQFIDSFEDLGFGCRKVARARMARASGFSGKAPEPVRKPKGKFTKPACVLTLVAFQPHSGVFAAEDGRYCTATPLMELNASKGMFVSL